MTEDEIAYMKSNIKMSSTMIAQSKRNHPFFNAFYIRWIYRPEDEQFQHHVYDDETRQYRFEQKHKLSTVSSLLKN